MGHSERMEEERTLKKIFKHTAWSIRNVGRPTM
jgi:hypothetical protein